MRVAIALLLTSWSAVAGAATLDVRIHDVFGTSYQTTEIGAQLGALYNIGFDPTLVLIIGPDLADERVVEQRRIVRAFDPNETGILFAIGTPEESYARGYSVTPNTSAELLPAPDGFRVLVLDANGTILHDSAEVLSAEELLALTPGN